MESAGAKGEPKVGKGTAEVSPSKNFLAKSSAFLNTSRPATNKQVLWVASLVPAVCTRCQGTADKEGDQSEPANRAYTATIILCLGIGDYRFLL